MKVKLLTDPIVAETSPSNLRLNTPDLFPVPARARRNLCCGRRKPAPEVELVRLDPQYRIIFGGAASERYPGPRANGAADWRHRAGRRAGFRRFLEENRTKLDRMLPCLENPFLGWQDMLNLRLLKTLPILRPHQSVPFSATPASAWPFPFSPNIWACHRSVARACFQFSRFWNMNTASSIRSAAAPR